jgi:MEKHLA domain
MPAATPWPPSDPNVLAARCREIAESLHRLTGLELLPGINPAAPAFAECLYQAPFVLVAHGTEADPVLNYGNATALSLWEMDWAAFTSTPSRMTAEAPDRAERTRLLDEVTKHGFIRNYTGVRISSTGRRFRITEALVWNVADGAGRPAGQAATFSHWTFLPA